MPSLTIEDQTYEAYHIPTANTSVLMIKASSGFLGCGYFDIAVANRVGDAVAIVTGVKDYDQMLAAPIVRMSDRARALGVTEGMSGLEALQKLQQFDASR